MQIGVLGTGIVGTTIATKLRELGHEVLIGSRSAKDDAVPFAEAAAHGELVFNCTSGVARAQEMYLPLWVRLMGVVGSPDFNVKVVH